MAGCFDRVCEPYARGTSPSLKAMYNDPWVVNRNETNWRISVDRWFQCL